MWRHRVTCLPPKNASAPWGGVGSRWLTVIIWQVSYIQYLLACQKSQRSTPYNIVKCGLTWKRAFRRRHLGRRVTAATCLRWPTVKPAWVLQMAPDVSICHTLQLCGWGIAHKRLGPPGIIHLGATSSNHTGTGLAYSRHTPTGSVETTPSAAAETPGCHNARISPQTMRNRFRPFTTGALSWIGNCVLQLGWTALTCQPLNWEQDFTDDLRFCLSILIGGSGCGVSEANVMPTPAILNMADRAVGVWWCGVEYRVVAGVDFSRWMAHSRSRVTWTRWFNLASALRPRWWADSSAGQRLSSLNLPHTGLP